MAVTIPAHVREQQINALPNIQFVRWVEGYRSNKSKAVCRCVIDGFEWAAAVSHLINTGRGCPQCAGNRPYTADERIAQINVLPNIRFVRWADGEYRNSASKAVCRCELDDFEWAASVKDLVKGRGCPQCAGVRRWTAEERIRQINAMPNISFVRWGGVYCNSKSKAICRCALDGFEWAAAVSSLISRGHGCPQCGGKRRWAAEERIEQINALPNLEFVQWVDGYKGSHSKAICRCVVDGYEWPVSISSLLSTGTGCPQCAGMTSRPAEERIAQIKALPNISFVRWVGEYTNAFSKAVCRCDLDGHEWVASLSNLLYAGTGCPACATIGYQPSKPGTLYFLRSECGTMVKIGISNNYKQRHTQLKRATPFDWHCIELLHSDDGSLIAEWEKELHSWTEQAEFREPFDGYTEWRKWDDRLPRWIKRYRARLDRYNKAP